VNILSLSYDVPGCTPYASRAPFRRKRIDERVTLKGSDRVRAVRNGKGASAEEQEHEQQESAVDEEEGDDSASHTLMESEEEP
jgi:hypothetical protein